MDKVSIIVPVYNVERYLDRCMETLVHQNYSNIEILLINDGSTDSSGSICRKWGGYSNVIVIEQENQGVSAARNKGLEAATGEFIMFVDPDDWCELDMVEKMVCAIGNCDFAYCAYSVDTDKSRKIMKNAVSNGVYSIEEIYTPLFFSSQNSSGTNMATVLWRGIFRTKIINDGNIRFDTYVRFAEDWLFYAEYFKNIKSVMLVDLPLYHYYLRSDSVTHIYNPASKLGVQKSCYILDKILKLASETEINTERYEPYMAKRYIGLVLNQVKNVWDKRNLLKKKEKCEFIEWTIKETNTNSKIQSMRYSNMGKVEKIMLWAIVHNVIFLLSGYGVCYNTIRDVRNWIRRL